MQCLNARSSTLSIISRASATSVGGCLPCCAWVDGQSLPKAPPQVTDGGEARLAWCLLPGSSFGLWEDKTTCFSLSGPESSSGKCGYGTGAACKPHHRRKRLKICINLAGCSHVGPVSQLRNIRVILHSADGCRSCKFANPSTYKTIFYHCLKARIVE